MNTVVFESSCVYVTGYYNIDLGAYGDINSRTIIFPFLGILKETSCSISLTGPYQSDTFFMYKLLIDKDIYDSFIGMGASYMVGTVEIQKKLMYFVYTTESDEDYLHIVSIYNKYKERASLLFKDKLF